MAVVAEAEKVPSAWAEVPSVAFALVVVAGIPDAHIAAIHIDDVVAELSVLQLLRQLQLAFL